MKILARTILFLAFCIRAAEAADSELTNYKTGIDVVWGVGDGSDKGTAYQEEYWYHDKLINDTKTVYIRDTTLIHMRHNDRNVATVTGRNKIVIGAHGLDGLPNTADEGKIRYEIDRLWNKQRVWANGKNLKPAYSSPFSLRDITFESGVPIVGTFGAKPGLIPENPEFYWRGMSEVVGSGIEEWHVLMVADDDEQLGSLYNDSWASDGKYILLNVNPKTPALTIRTSGDAQFYTTPAWTYWVPKIHAQTTYFSARSGSVTFELRNIYGGAISYRINGGGTVNVGGPSTTLNQSHFTAGNNTVEYWYTATPTVIRTRTVVKDPPFPSSPVAHGNRIWGDAAWEAFSKDRHTRQPYSSRVANAQTSSGSGQYEWDQNRRKGLRFGGSNWPHQSGPMLRNAVMAKYKGWTASRPGTTKTYAEYAKEMLLETHLNQHPVGMEAPYWASSAIPCADLYYRGYWDVDFAFDAAAVYDILISEYRSDRYSGGITPIEDYFIRDRLADHVHQCALVIGGFAEQYIGMWNTCRNIGATMITCVLPNYSTRYFGTSGVDGNTTTFTWAPYESSNYTWKDLFLTHTFSTTTFGKGPWQGFGLEGTTDDGALLREEGRVVTVDGTAQKATWVDRLAYTSFGQCGHVIMQYANLASRYDSGKPRPALDKFIDELTKGTLYGAKITGSETYGPRRSHAILCQNAIVKQASANATAWIQSLPSTDGDSDDKALQDADMFGLFFYDDKHFGGALPSLPGSPTGLALEPK